jgi:serine/threonine protein kinase
MLSNVAPFALPGSRSVDFFTYFQRDDSLFGGSHLKQVSDYSLRAKIGSGSSSKVYLGVHVRTGETYAVKRVNLQKLSKHGDAIAQLEREIRLMRSFSHPNILKLIEVLHRPSTDEAYLVLEYAGKGCLGGFLDRQQPITVPSILSILKQLARALKCLHESGIAHQDIKPWNILIDEDGRAILADFGIGHTFGSACMVVGSPAYQAPEALDDTYCDEDLCDSMPDKEDVWALGVTFYQLLFQRLPFEGETLFEIVNFINEVGLKIPEETDPALAEILTGMLTIDPHRRWDIAEVLACPAVAAAADRAMDLPAVPWMPLIDGDAQTFFANVCP